MRRTYLISCNARVKSWSLKVESKLEREGKLDGSRLQSSHFIILDFGSKRRKPWLGFFSVCATNLQIIIHPDLPSFEESFTRVFHSFVDYTRGSRKEIRGKPLLSCAISCAKSRTK